MKKTVILGILLLSALAANAQLRWDIRAGVNVSQFSEGGAGLKLGIKAGVSAEYGFSQLFALRPGLYFSMNGSSEDRNFASGFPAGCNLSYIELPVLASFRFPVTSGFALALNAGPYMACRINKEPKLMPSASTFDTGIEAGLDFVFGHFSFGPSAQYGLTNAVKTDAMSLHNICYTLTLGYKF